MILRCTADANPPITTYEIYQNGSLISNSSSGILNITRAIAEHAGLYVCVPYNVYGRGESASLNVSFVGKFVRFFALVVCKIKASLLSISEKSVYLRMRGEIAQL